MQTTETIALLATGGTIASTMTDNGLAPSLTAEALAESAGLRALADIHPIDVFSMDSSNIQPEEWCELAQAVRDALTHCKGVVITHGTDTMAYTAAALTWLLWDIDKPVILTGSQLPMGHPLSDGRSNLRGALSTALSGVPGVYIAFHNKIISGSRAVKTRTTSFDAFSSVNAPLAGHIDSDGVHFAYPLLHKLPAASYAAEIDPRVFLMKIMPGTMPDVFDFVISAGYRGVVLEAFGLGGLHYIRRNLVDKLKSLAQHGIYTLVVTQCLYEKTDFAIYEVGSQILSDHVFSGGDLTTEAAVTLMMWALAQTDTPGLLTRATETL